METIELSGIRYEVRVFKNTEMELFAEYEEGKFNYSRHSGNFGLWHSLGEDEHENVIWMAGGFSRAQGSNNYIPQPTTQPLALIVKENGVRLAVTTTRHLETELVVPLRCVVTEQYHMVRKLNLLISDETT